MNRGRWLAVTLALGMAPLSVSAIENYDPTNLSALTNDAVNSLIKTAAVGGSHKTYLPAKPLGHVIGVDLSLTADIISIPQEFKDALSAVSGQPSSGIPALVPIPKIALYKGLPGGVDLGGSYVSYQDKFKSAGGAIRFGVQAPSVLGGLWINAQATGNYTKILFLSTHTYSFDLTASKGFALVEPYIGVGIQRWSGELTYSTSAGGFQTGVSGSQSGTHPHVYFGLPFKLLALRLTAQIDRSFAGITTYGAKLGLSF